MFYADCLNFSGCIIGFCVSAISLQASNFSGCSGHSWELFQSLKTGFPTLCWDCCALVFMSMESDMKLLHKSAEATFLCLPIELFCYITWGFGTQTTVWLYNRINEGCERKKSLQHEQLRNRLWGFWLWALYRVISRVHTWSESNGAVSTLIANDDALWGGWPPPQAYTVATLAILAKLLTSYDQGSRSADTKQNTAVGTAGDVLHNASS